MLVPKTFESRLDLQKEGPDKAFRSNMSEMKECRLREFGKVEMQLREEISKFNLSIHSLFGLKSQ